MNTSPGLTPNWAFDAGAVNRMSLLMLILPRMFADRLMSESALVTKTVAR